MIRVLEIMPLSAHIHLKFFSEVNSKDDYGDKTVNMSSMINLVEGKINLLYNSFYVEIVFDTKIKLNSVKALDKINRLKDELTSHFNLKSEWDIKVDKSKIIVNYKLSV